MRKIVLLIILFLGSVSLSLAESEIYDEPPRIKLIEIHVKSCTAIVKGKFPNGSKFSKKFPAGTPTPKNTKDVPFGRKGTVYKITLNPPYTPTETHIAQEKKRGRKVKDSYPPNDKENPLGIMKMYFAFSDIDPNLSFGMHTTNKPGSVGHRVSEGCARLSEDDAQEIFGMILKQNGYDAVSLFEEMRENPGKQIVLELKDRPGVIYYND